MARLYGKALLLLAVSCVAILAVQAGRPQLKVQEDSASEQVFVKPNGPYKNVKPLIGIMTQPCHDCPGKSYIAAGFVKWIEAAGARAVPIRFYDSDAELRRIFNSINGIIFPGGLTWLWLDAPYVITARKLFNWAVEANNKGDVFPIHGTCLGFQLLHILASNVSRNDLLVDTDSVSHATTLDWTTNAKESRLFDGMSKELMDKIASADFNLTLENHMYGMPPDMYNKYPTLKEWYTPITTTKDRNGIEYISTMEGKKYPFTGTQWHPEKPPYEFGIPEIPHTLDAIRISQHLANSFVDIARYSSHVPESKEEELALQVYDVAPIFSARFEAMAEDNYDGPDMTYYFDTPDKPPHGPDDGDDTDPNKHVARSYAEYKKLNAAAKLRNAREAEARHKRRSQL